MVEIHGGAMNDKFVFSKRERFWLWITAIVGLIGPNGVFLYYAVYHHGDFSTVSHHPVMTAFMVDAFGATAILAYLFARWRVSRLSWIWFVVLSLVGGLMFSIPAFLLIGETKEVSPSQK